MKNKIKNLILCLIMCLTTNTAFSYNLSNAELTKIINTRIQNEILNEFSNYSNDIRINISGIPNANILTYDSTIPKIEIVSNSTRFQPNSLKRVLVKDSKNNLVKSFPINVQTRIYKDVIVANTVIPYNSEINATNTTLVKREVSRYLGKVISEYPNGLLAKRNYPKGSMIFKDSLKERASVLKNSNVNIVFVSGKGIRIKVQGKALKEGAIGDTILVRSSKFNRIYNAEVNGINEVTVRI